ncbi:MAG: FAD-dependent oxidoreductase [Chitinophagaceae bacterium]
MIRYLIIFCLLMPARISAQQINRTVETDVLVIGGGVGGTAAAIQAARMGVKTILMEQTNMLGGMLTAAGVSCTDGNDQLPSGMWEEFRQALYKHYGRNKLNSGWVSNTNFEPHVGDSIFKAWAGREKKLKTYFGYSFESVQKVGNKVTGATFHNKDLKKFLTVKANVVIDATELGDVFAAAGADYDLGMDDPAVSGEKEAREKNAIIQDLTWAAILKDYGPTADKTIERPANYDPTKYYCCNTEAPCTDKSWNGDKLKMLNYGKLPRSPGATVDKYMLNWPAHGNDIYLNVVEDSQESRVRSYELAKQHTLGFIYFLQTQLGMKNIGLADDELDGGLALIPYNREGRRVKGMVRMNINHIKNPYDYNLYRTGISVGDYPVDHHHAQYPGKVPEIEFPPIPSFNIPMGALIPEKIDGLIVCEKGISVSNIVNGTTRLQPVVLLTGQAAGILAAKVIVPKKKHIEVRQVPVRAVQEELLKAKAYLLPFVDVKPDNPYWEVIQKIGVTGILRGNGKAEGWGNKMFFYPDSTVVAEKLEDDISEYVQGYEKLNDTPEGKETFVSISQAFKILERIYFTINQPRGKYPSVIDDVFKSGNFDKIWVNMGLQDYRPDRPVKRFELAVLFHSLIDLFEIKGRYINNNGK